MDAITFVSRYAWWHYTRAWADLTRVFFNLAWFCWRIFSVPELVANLLTPFERMEERPTGRMPADIGSALLVTTIMRVVGAVVRLPIIAVGVVLTLAIVCAWLTTYLLWAFLPVLSPLLIVAGALKLLGLA